jgi:pSer/pThr/pTyr-binding forkhead associated (FHA) protein
MALIVELRDVRGQITRQRLDGRALTLGRGLANDVILDDPYVDACHARISRDEDGAWCITDLGSLNGIVAHGVRAHATIPVLAGTEVRIGRTLLRFRDTEEAVAPALADDEASSTAATVAAVPPAPASDGSHDARPPRRGFGAVIGTRGRLLVICTMLAAFTLNAWLTNTTRSPGGAVFGFVLTTLGLLSVWAAVWAAATRPADRRFHFLGHLTVVSEVLLGALVAAELTEWLTFLFPDAAVVYLLSGAAYLVLAAALVAGHLGVAGVLPPRRRWRVGTMVSGAILALILLATFAKEETFSDVPEIASTLKPLAPAWIPTERVDDFGAAIRKTRTEADDAAKKDVPH